MFFFCCMALLVVSAPCSYLKKKRIDVSELKCVRGVLCLYFRKRFHTFFEKYPKLNNGNDSGTTTPVSRGT